MDIRYRHEWKHEINAADRLALLARLKAVMRPDPHAPGGSYRIRSLYFDTPDDKALRGEARRGQRPGEVPDPLLQRGPLLSSLEKKSKLNGLCSKQSCRVSEAEARRLVAGDDAWLLDPARPLCGELYSKIRSQGLGPKTIVDYTREPFVFAPGNVRVTLDYDIRTREFRTDFLNPDA